MSSQATLLASKPKGGILFHYKLPRTGLSLRSVKIGDDGLPELHFNAANCRDLPTLTEEDVATVARVVSDGKRPEFFYTAFHIFHPFMPLGRAYKQYCPQYLRGTSVGDLLSEADWSMKCLNVGTRSNETKTEFWSWQETSNLENLAVHMDFPSEKTKNGCVMMSCDCIKLDESKNEIFFTEEPKMRITDETSPMYSEYITTYYDSVAFYDEPLFLKMQELMKLIIAIEWMKEKGIVFNEEWQKEHTEKSPQQTKALDVTPYEKEEIEALLKQSEATNNSLSQELGPLKVKIEVSKETPSGIEHTIEVVNPDYPLMKQITKVRTSYNDYDFLFEKCDCRMPVSLTSEGKPLIPDVASWNELYAETIASPQTVDVFPETTVFCGGITTQNIPVKKQTTMKAETHIKETVPIKANVKKEKLIKPSRIPECVPVVKPPNNIPANTKQAQRNKETSQLRMHGIRSYDEQVLQSENTGIGIHALKQTRSTDHEVAGVRIPSGVGQLSIEGIHIDRKNTKVSEQVSKNTGQKQAASVSSSVTVTKDKQEQLQARSSHEKIKPTKHKTSEATSRSSLSNEGNNSASSEEKATSSTQKTNIAKSDKIKKKNKKRVKKVKKMNSTQQEGTTSHSSSASDISEGEETDNETETDDETNEEVYMEEMSKKKQKNIPPPLNIQQQHTNDIGIPSPTDSGMGSPPNVLSPTISEGVAVKQQLTPQTTDDNGDPSSDSGIGSTDSSPNTSPPLSPNGQQVQQQNFAHLDDVVLPCPKKA